MNHNKHKLLLTITFLLFFKIFLFADTYIVTNTAATGPGTLDNAMEMANDHSGADTITFNLPGDGPFYLTTLQPFWYEKTVLDATTQPDYYLGKIVIGTDENNLDGLTIFGSQTEIYGIKAGILHLDGAPACRIGGLDKGNVLEMIYMKNSDNVIIQSNRIGTNIEGTESAGTISYGIEIMDCENVLIGGDLPAEGNLISGNGDHGMWLIDMDNGVIKNNKIGTDITGTYAIPNAGRGIAAIVHAPITIGDSEETGNLISGNMTDGISTSSVGAGCLIKGNKIGTDITGVFPIPNGGRGYATGGQTSLTFQENLVAFNGGVGLWVGPDIINPKRIIQNQFICNEDGGYTIDVPHFAEISFVSDSLLSGISNAPESTVEIFWADTLTCLDLPCQGQKFIASVLTENDASGSWALEGEFESGYYMVNITNVTQRTSMISNCILLEVEPPNLVESVRNNDFILFQNQPNPFWKETTVKIDSPRKIEGILKIFDQTGQTVWTLNQSFSKGENIILINRKDLPVAGIYFYQFIGGGMNLTRKMLVY